MPLVLIQLLLSNLILVPFLFFSSLFFYLGGCLSKFILVCLIFTWSIIYALRSFQGFLIISKITGFTR